MTIAMNAPALIATEPGSTAALQRRVATAKAPRGQSVEPASSFDALLKQAAPGALAPAMEDVQAHANDMPTVHVEDPGSAADSDIPADELNSPSLDWSAWAPLPSPASPPSLDAPPLEIVGTVLNGRVTTTGTGDHPSPDAWSFAPMTATGPSGGSRDAFPADPALRPSAGADAQGMDFAVRPALEPERTPGAQLALVDDGRPSEATASRPGDGVPGADSLAQSGHGHVSWGTASSPRAAPGMEPQGSRPPAIDSGVDQPNRTADVRRTDARQGDRAGSRHAFAAAPVAVPLDMPAAEQARGARSGVGGTPAGEGGVLTTPTQAVASAISPASPPPTPQGLPTAAPMSLGERFTPSPPQGYAASRVDTPMTDDAFPRVLGIKIGQWINDDVQQVWLDVHPADMGPVAIQISVDGRQAELNFGVESATARQVIEASLPELASALQSAGLTLSGGSISQDMPQPRSGADQDGQRGRAAATRQTGQGPAGGADLPIGVRQAPPARGLLDLYA